MHLGVLRGYEQENNALVPASVPPLKQLGKEIREADYKTDYSAWKFEHPEDVTGRETNIDEGLATLDALFKKKLAKLEDDLAREKFRVCRFAFSCVAEPDMRVGAVQEELRMANEQHIDRHGKIKAWVEESSAYLAVEEKVDSIRSVCASAICTHRTTTSRLQLGAGRAQRAGGVAR